MADRQTLPEPGDVIAGKYRIDCALGTGGMGAVFQVTHRVTGKRFALKWLLPQVSGQGDAAQRFIREAQVAGRFEHPNVVEVYDVGSDGDSFYMVMELLEGESLAERVERSGPLSVTEACELLIPCLRGIAEAHAAGIVHRDLKPANIFICKATRNEREFAKVLDFGISKISGAPGGDVGEGMTKSGMLIGTPHYMPLEQMRGRSVDHRADIYAFGVVLYQVLTGELPFPADSFSDLVLMLANDTPTPLENVVPRLPRGLSQVVACAMHRDPEGRFQSVDELIVALEPYAGNLARASSHAPGPSRLPMDASLSIPTPLSTESRMSARPPAAEPQQNLAWVAGAAAALVLAVGVGAFFLTRDARQPSAAKPAVVQPAPAAHAAGPEPTTQHAINAATEPPARQALGGKPESAPVAVPEPKPSAPAEAAMVRSTSTRPAATAPRSAQRAPAHPRRGQPVAANAPAKTETAPTIEPAKEVREPKPRSVSSRVPAISENDFY